MNPWVIIAILWLPLSALAALTIGRWMRGPKTPAPAPSTGPVPARNPVPGHGLPPGKTAAPRTQRPAPAPGPPTVPDPVHITGPISFIVYGWECGCELDFDGSGRVIWATGCGTGTAHSRFDDWLKGLTDGV